MERNILTQDILCGLDKMNRNEIFKFLYITTDNVLLNIADKIEVEYDNTLFEAVEPEMNDECNKERERLVTAILDKLADDPYSRVGKATPTSLDSIIRPYSKPNSSKVIIGIMERIIT